MATGDADVTGLVLTIGEATTGRAIASLEAQTTPCREIVGVENVTPFSRAMNAGIERIETPFFIQCDADMVPDADCVEVLRSHFSETIGVVIAYLDDALLGEVQAIKMFRTACFDHVRFANHVSPDTRTIEAIAGAGWPCVFASRGRPRHGHPAHVLGRHDPDYAPLYTFNKFRLEGARIRDRGSATELEETLDALRRSGHPSATIAIVGLCQGLLRQERTDGLVPFRQCGDYDTLMEFMRDARGEP